MRRTIFSFATVLVLMSPAVSGRLAQAQGGVGGGRDVPGSLSTEDEKELIRLEDHWVGAEARADRGALQEIITPWFVLTDPEGVAHFYDAYRKGVGVGGVLTSKSHMRVRIERDFAVVTGRGELRLASGKTRVIAFTDVFQKEQDAWRCTASQRTFVKDPSRVPNEPPMPPGN